MNAKAVHIRDDDNNHVVGLGAIRVLICHEGDEWLAQGVEVDYAASGTSLEDVQGRFERGLELTVRAHLTMHDTIDGLLKYAPGDILKMLPAEEEFNFDQVSYHDLPESVSHSIPFSKVAYINDACAA